MKEDEKRKRELEDAEAAKRLQQLELSKKEELRKRELHDAEAARRLQQMEISKKKGGISNGTVAGMGGVGAPNPPEVHAIFCLPVI